MAVIVGYIPTAEGQAALTRAAEEARMRRSKLVVVNSQRGGRGYDADDARQFDAELERIKGMLDGEGVEHEVRQLVRGNEPAEDLIEVADAEGRELIVIGLRRRTPVGKLLLGSNAQRILLEANCPVLAVKSEG